MGINEKNILEFLKNIIIFKNIKKKMNIAGNNKKYYDFSELNHQSEILEKKRKFFDNYLKNGIL